MGTIQITEYPCYMAFDDKEWEKEFRTYFHARQINNDVFFSAAQVFIGVALLRRVAETQEFSKIGAYLVVCLVQILLDFFLARLSFRSREAYIALRTPITLFRQALKTIILMSFLPSNIFISSPHLSHMKPLIPFIFIIMKLCIFPAFTANGYGLIAYHQTFSALINLTGPASIAYTLAHHPELLGIEHDQSQVCSYASKLLGALLQSPFPLSLAGKTGGPFPGPAPCFLVYSWALGTFGFILSMALGELLEHKLRIQFAEQKRYYIPSPALGWSLAHCALQVIFGGHLLWVLLSAVTTFFTY